MRRDVLATGLKNHPVGVEVGLPEVIHDSDIVRYDELLIMNDFSTRYSLKTNNKNIHGDRLGL